MNQQKLPVTVNPRVMAEHNACLKGTICLSDLPGIADIISSKEGTAFLQLDFCFDEQRRIVMKGCIKAELLLTCQRCLESLTHCVNDAFVLSPVSTDEQARALPAVYDPWIVQDDKIKLIDLIDEELLLSLPVAPRHPAEACSLHVQTEINERDTEQSQLNPFAILANNNSK